MNAEDTRILVERAQTLVTYLRCPYFRGEGQCATGCRDEPACQTNGPYDDEIVGILSELADLDVPECICPDDPSDKEGPYCPIHGEAERLADLRQRSIRLEQAMNDCIDTAAELRRHIQPYKGCGYSTYRQVWDASMAAEIAGRRAIDDEGPHQLKNPLTGGAT